MIKKWILVLTILGSTAFSATADDALVQGFHAPPDSAKTWVYWWWLGGYVSKDGIRRDLDAMREHGISGALVFHAGSGKTPESTVFMSPEWREFFRFAVEEAARRNITIGLNLCGGWNAGGPWVEVEDGVKVLTHATTTIRGPKDFDAVLPNPTDADPTYHDVAVLAWPVDSDSRLKSKGLLDLTDKMDANGRLRWNTPDGEWRVVRFGWKIPSRGYTKCTGGTRQREIDPLDPRAIEKHFAATAGVVIEDVRPHVGKTFKYVHIDSGEIGHPDWTPRFREQFKRLRGYDPFPYIAAKAGHVVDSAEIAERFLEDYERTIGDLMIECYYARLGELAGAHGLGTHSEAAGYQKPTVDALRAMGCNDICMSEYWARKFPGYAHQLAEIQLHYHDGIRNAASAARIYGRRIVQAEAYTVIRGMNYGQAPFDLKDIGDRAFCAGLNRNVLHQYMCQADERAKPGYVWPGIGTEFDRHSTWWPMGSAWLAYLARCQHVLQQGRFVGDVCYLQGDWVPAYVPARWAMDPPLPSGFDCDTINTEALIDRASVDEDGRLVLPDGQSYRYLVLWQGGRWQLPPKSIFESSAAGVKAPRCPAKGSGMPLALRPATMRRLKELIEAGVTVIGPRPSRAIGLTDYPNNDAEVNAIADSLWGAEPDDVGQREIGKGRLIWGQSLADVFRDDRLIPDLDIRESRTTKSLPAETLSGIPSPATFDWIHRTIDGTDVYFIANLRNAPAASLFLFRNREEHPELWDAVTGKMRDAVAFKQTDDGRTVVPLEFPPRGSMFVVFRKPIPASQNGPARRNRPRLAPAMELTGPWTVQFDPKWGGPESVTFERLEDWTKRPEPGIRHYSGTATYRKTFDLPKPLQGGEQRTYLNLGKVNHLAAVRLNGKPLGVAWTAPWQVEITAAVQPTGNHLEIDVANLWNNRLVGDAGLPPEERLTTTNVTRFKKETPLLSSGLLGPVSVMADSQVAKLGDSVVDAEALTIQGGFGQSINGLSFQQDAVATHLGYQYVTYYDAKRHVCLARRRLPDGEWRVVQFGDYTFRSNDAHNTISLGICPRDGTIHLAFDHHGHPLHYRASKKGVATEPRRVAWEPSLFGPVTSELEEGKPIAITYPRFWQTPDGGLQFGYRRGRSGAGDRMLVDYSPEMGTWHGTRQIDSGIGPFEDHLGKSNSRCSYPNGYTYGPKDRLHATWVWRESSQGANHDLIYSYSEDRGKTWLNNRGETLPQPPGVGSPDVKVVDISRAYGLINTQAQAVDSQGRVHVVMWHCTDRSLEATGSKPGELRWGPPAARRYHHYWRDAGAVWHHVELPQVAGDRPKLFMDQADNAYLIYNDGWKRGMFSLEGNLVIAAATAGSRWGDWKIVHIEKGPFLNEMLGDVYRWTSEEVLSIMVQESPGKTHEPTALRILDFSLKGNKKESR